MQGALTGIRILDLSSVLMGPYATQMLGDMGADVIKVEPLEGDRTRRNGLARHVGMSGWFMGFNRSKRSLSLNLKTAEGLKIMFRLVGSADVLLYNVRPDAMERLGLGYEKVSAANSRLLYVGALGFGRGGDYSGLAAFDDLIQAATGMPWLFHFAGAAEPRFCPTPIVDRLMGTQVAMNILGGLMARERTGRGQQIDVPMFETMAQIMLGDHLGGEAFEPPIGQWGYRRMLAPERRPYRTKNGFIAALPYYAEQWSRFFEAVDRSYLYDNDTRFATPEDQLRNINELYIMVSDIMIERTTEEWLSLFRELDIPSMPVSSIPELINNKHLGQVGFFEEFDHPSEGRMRQIRTPSTWSETQPRATRAAPQLGEQTREILIELGFNCGEIDKLAEDNVIREWAKLS